jgi:hypothetical protein
MYHVASIYYDEQVVDDERVINVVAVHGNEIIASAYATGRDVKVSDVISNVAHNVAQSKRTD